MASSCSSALQDGRTTNHKEMAAIAADWLAGRELEDASASRYEENAAPPGEPPSLEELWKEMDVALWEALPPAERALVGAGIVLYLVLGLAKQRLARFIALFVGSRSLCHPHAVLPALEAAIAGVPIRVEQRLMLRPLRGDLLLRL